MYISKLYASLDQNIKLNKGIVFHVLVEKIESIIDYALFVRLLLEKIGVQEIHILDMSQDRLDILYKDTAMLFLGLQKHYFIVGFDALNIKQKKEVMSYFASINSPHFIYIFSKDISTKEVVFLNIPYYFFKEEARTFIQFFLPKTTQQINYFLDKIEMKKNKISLHVLLLLLQYIKVVSSNSSEFFQEWLPRIFKSDHSLFTLAEYFFAGDIQNFLSVWKKYKEEYSFPFWTTFFSEQLFKATLYLTAKTQNKIPEKEIEFRLPFSFLKKDWKLHSIEKLTNAHHEVCMLDIKFKQGEIREDALELFCIKFMNNLV